MTQKKYRVICALSLFLFICGFFGVMNKLTLYLESGSDALTSTNVIQFNDHGTMIYITKDQYKNLKIMSFFLVTNLIITGVFAYKAKIPYGGDWLDS